MTPTRSLHSNSSKTDLEERKSLLHDQLAIICYEMLEIGVIRTINYLKTHHVGEQVIFFSDWDGLKCMIGQGKKSITQGQKLIHHCWLDMPESVKNYFTRAELNVQFVNETAKLRENVALIMFSEYAQTWLTQDTALIEKAKLEKLTSKKVSKNNLNANQHLLKKNRI